MFHWKRKLLPLGSPQIGTAIGAAVGIGGSILSSKASSRAADRASDAQTAAAYAGIDEQGRQFDKLQANYDKIRELLNPYIEAGSAGLEAQRSLLGLNGQEAQGQLINYLQTSPIYTSALKAGENAILQNASATGGLRGGNTQNALSRYSGDLLSTVIQNQLGSYGGLANSGQNAVNGLGSNSAALGQAQTGISNNISNLLQQVGASQAGNAIAQGNAQQKMFGGISQGIGTLVGGLAF